MGKYFGGAVTNFNKKYRNCSAALLGDIPKFNAHDFIAETEKAFETPFFEILRKYLKEQDKGPGFLQTITDMTLLDARSIHSELT
jgi:hypothetical protein